MAIDKNYMALLKERAKKNRIYQKHQLVGLYLAELLKDPSHKALYIRLAKQFNEITLIQLAQRVAERKNIKNRGAYFMKLLADPLIQKLKKPLAKKPKKRKVIQKSLFKFKSNKLRKRDFPKLNSSKVQLPPTSPDFRRSPSFNFPRSSTS